MKYSVVIPALNEEGMVGAAVNRLKLQSVGRENIEIIVVDNNSSDNTSLAARSAGADKVLFEKRSGTNFTRNTGYDAATGDVVAFLDADCVPLRDWLLKIGNILKDEEVGAVSGPFDYGFRGIKEAMSDFWLVVVMPAVPNILHFFFRRKAGMIIGGNFAVRRGVMEKVGGFPPLSFWGDDAAIAMLIARKYGKVVFTSDIAVKSSPRRLEKEGFFRLTLKYVRAYLREYFRN